MLLIRLKLSNSFLGLETKILVREVLLFFLFVMSSKLMTLISSVALAERISSMFLPSLTTRN